MPHILPVFHFDEVDDSDPGAPRFATVHADLARRIGDAFRERGCLIECEGRTYRPFLMLQPRPGWWAITARSIR